ncbi:MAG: class I SAM-dependent methyltransferase [Nitrospirales bacterium]
MRFKDIRTFVKMYVQRCLGNRHEKKVLDVGSGHRPNKEATHLVDLWQENNSERGKSIKRHGRPLIVATLEALPFKDQTFDYIIASHVVEHVEDPTQACNELIRVGRAGYVETPSPFYEQGYNFPNPIRRGWSFHRWFVFLDDNQTLIFEPKNQQTIDTFCDCRYSHFIKGLYSKVDDLNRMGEVLPHDCNNTVLHWKGRFQFHIRSNPQVIAPRAKA